MAAPPVGCSTWPVEVSTVPCRALDLVVQRRLQRLLQTGVDVGDHVVTRLGLGLAQAAHHLALGVHLDVVRPRLCPAGYDSYWFSSPSWPYSSPSW